MSTAAATANCPTPNTLAARQAQPQEENAMNMEGWKAAKAICATNVSGKQCLATAM